MKRRFDFLGLSSESKPTIEHELITNGSTYYEVDTSITYIWYNDRWYEKKNLLSEKLIIQASSNTPINGYQVPLLSEEEIIQAYNGIVAGNEVVVTDYTGNMHFKVNQADSVNGDIIITFLYFDVMILSYEDNGTITFKEI